MGRTGEDDEASAASVLEVPSGVLEPFGPRPRGRPPRTQSAERATVHVDRNLPWLEVWDLRNSDRKWAMLHEAYVLCVLGPREPTPPLMRWRCRQRDMTLGPGSVMLLEPGDVHVVLDLSGPADFRVVLVARDYVERMFGQNPPTWRNQVDGDGRLVRLLDELWTGLVRDRLPASERERRARVLLRHAFATGAAARRNERGPAPVVAAARAILHGAFARPDLALSDIAEAAGTSVSHLEHTFKAVVGVPVHQYLLRVRVSRALDLLRAGRRPSDILEEVGFTDQAQMTRTFRRIVGFTPGEYHRAAGA